MKRKLLLVFIIIPVMVFSQNLDDYFYKIDLKLLKDKSYLDIYYIDFPSNGNEIINLVKNISPIPKRNGDPFSFKSNVENITYRFAFLKDSPLLDPIVLLYVDELTDKSLGSTSIFGETGVNVDTQRVLFFSSIYSLKMNDPATYKKLLKLIEDVLLDEFSPPSSLLGFDPYKDVNVSTVPPARNNEDYLNFSRSNSNHWFPPDDRVKRKRKVSAPKTEEVKTTSPETTTSTENQTSTTTTTENETTTDSLTTEPPIQEPPKVETVKKNVKTQQTSSTSFKLDASLSSISFTHEYMNFGLGTAGIEVNVGEKVLNFLPWQTNTISAGLRTLLSLSSESTALNDKFLIDTKIMGRFKINLKSITNSFPLLMADSSRLNIGTAACVDMHFSRPFSLPFLNLYFATGGQAFSQPVVKINSVKQKDTAFAYFSFIQAEISMSFYWNADNDKVARFRMDVGAGYYDVWKAIYKTTAVKPRQTILIQDKFIPMVSMYFYLSPQNNDIFGAKIRFFDSQLMMSAWLKLLDFSEDHSIRFETQYLTAPFFRNPEPWETGARGVYFQLRYRYGYNF